MSKLRRIKFIPFERLCNVNSAIWIETSLNLTNSLPFSEKFKISYDSAIISMTSKPLDKGSSYKDILNELINNFEAADMPLRHTYAYTRDRFYGREEEKKLNKGIDLFKNIIFIPANLAYYPEIIKSFYILCP